jgi:hypothetical protein
VGKQDAPYKGYSATIYKDGGHHNGGSTIATARPTLGAAKRWCENTTLRDGELAAAYQRGIEAARDAVADVDGGLIDLTYFIEREDALAAIDTLTEAPETGGGE